MLTQQYIKECFHYDKNTGDFVWKERPLSHFINKRAYLVFNSKMPGKAAGSKDASGTSLTSYCRTQITTLDGRASYRLHRLAWLYVYGKDPVNCIDHINGNGLDNRIKNLRTVRHSENNKNSAQRKDNTSGYTGVSYRRDSKVWRAYIAVNGKIINLGTYRDIEGAVSARKKAEIKYKYHENHGRKHPVN
jgi:hypothetical protein